MKQLKQTETDQGELLWKTRRDLRPAEENMKSCRRADGLAPPIQKQSIARSGQWEYLPAVCRQGGGWTPCPGTPGT